MKEALKNIGSYFKCMLKSTQWNPVFYSPSLTITTEDDDGGKVIDFSQRAGDDSRERPNGKIYVPTKTYEECEPYLYVCFDSDLVTKGCPRFLTASQMTKCQASLKKSKDTSASIPTD